MSRQDTRPSCEHYDRDSNIPWCLLAAAPCNARKCGRIADEERFDYEAELVDVCVDAAIAMGVYTERIGQRKAKGAGNEKAAPDLYFYCNGQTVPCEMKRFRDGRLSLDQIVAIERRAACGVETAVVRRLEDFVSAVNRRRMARGVVRRA